MISYLREHPDSVSYGIGGRGDGPDIAALIFNQIANVKAVAVPFRGDGQALPQLLGNHISYMFIGVPAAGATIQAGLLKGLAVTVDEGIVMLRACVVLRLTISSKRVDCAAGKLAGRAPFMIAAT
jgi:tripartite-type tricarboxylate transporter receptor subunit TctC